MQGASGEVERARIKQKEAALSGGDCGKFWKAYVIADGDGYFTIRGKIDERDFVAW